MAVLYTGSRQSASLHTAFSNSPLKWGIMHDKTQTHSTCHPHGFHNSTKTWNATSTIHQPQSMTKRLNQCGELRANLIMHDYTATLLIRDTPQQHWRSHTHDVEFEGLAPMSVSSTIECTITTFAHRLCASRTPIIRSCARHLHTANRWCNADDVVLMNVAALRNIRPSTKHTATTWTELYRQRRHRLAAMKISQTNVPPSSNKMKTDTSNAVQHVTSFVTWRRLLAVWCCWCPRAVEMYILPSSVVPVPDSCLLSLLSYRNTRPEMYHKSQIHNHKSN